MWIQFGMHTVQCWTCAFIIFVPGSLSDISEHCRNYFVEHPLRHFCLPPSYSKDVLPKMENGSPLNVNIDLILTQVIHVDDFELTTRLAMYMELSWIEPRIELNQSGSNQSESLILLSLSQLELFWIPDLEIIELDGFRSPNTIMRIGSFQLEAGKLLRMALPVEITVRCPFIYDEYPMDEQTCPLRFGSFGYQSDLMLFSGTVKYESDNQRFLKYHVKVRDMPKSEEQYTYQAGDQSPEVYSTYGFDLVLTRDQQAHLMRTYLPTGVLVVISWISFLVDPAVVPGRMAILVTLLLVLINVSNSVSTNIPLAKSLTAVEIWLLSCLGFVFAALMEYAYLLYYLMDARHSLNGNAAKQKMAWTTAIAFPETPTKSHGKRVFSPTKKLEASTNRNEPLANLDKIALVLFPMGFVLFNIAYWCIHLF